MVSKSEQGLPLNVANFRILVESCATYGAPYNPGNTAISLAALQTKLAESEQALAQHLEVIAAIGSASNAREELFDDLQVFTTRIMGVLTSFDVSPLTLADAKAAVRKLRGRRAKKAPTAADQPPANPGEESPAGTDAPVTARSISATQRSYDQQLQHFSRLVNILGTEASYLPNEPELTLAGLQNHRNALATAIAQVAAQKAAFKASLGRRNTVLYDSHTGLPALARAVKGYVKALFGPNSPQYLAIKGLSFRTKP